MIVRAMCFLVWAAVLSAGVTGCAGGSASTPAAALAGEDASRNFGCGPRPVSLELDPLPLEEARAAADLIFAGRVLGTHDPIPLSMSVPTEDLVLDYGFEVYRLWKGPPQDTLWVRTYRAPESGGAQLYPEGVYLIYAFRDDDRFWTNRCTRTALANNAPADLYALGAPLLDDESGRLPDFDRETLSRQLRAMAAPTRLKALRSLEQIARQDPGVLPLILDAYSEQRGKVRLDFIATLGRLGPKAKGALPVLIESLADPDPGLRAMAAASLGKIGPLTPEVLPALMGALEDEDPVVRGASAQALGAMGPDAAEAAPALRGLLNDPEPRVRDMAAQSLQIIGGASR